MRTQLLLSVLICSCATAPSVRQGAPETTYFGGTMTVSSVDGATPYGPPREALVARTVDREHGTIIEVVLDKGALRTTTMTRTGETNVFSSTDAQHSFTGSLTMTGTGWAFTGWTYDITMSDGSGRIEGSATIGETGIETTKYFVAPDGTKKVLIRDSLKPISKTDYDAKLPR